MSLELHLRVAGLIQLALAAAHVPFPRMFDWKTELARLSLINRQIFIVHTLFIVLVLLMFGLISLFAPGALTEPTRLGLLAAFGLGTFWLARFAAQHFIYDPALWRGDRAKTTVHVAVSVVWLYLTCVYAAVAHAQYTAQM